MNKNIAILGCPRSGTSLIANLIKSAGYDADCHGTKQLMKPNLKFNPDGYFERIDIVKINDILIDLMDNGCSFLNPPNFQKMINYTTDNKSFKFVLENLNSYNGWFIKDSRLCFTMHLYDVKNLNIVKVVRKPDNVKSSMINHYGNLFEQDVKQGPHLVRKIDFDQYYTYINNCIDWQLKDIPNITINYEDVLNNRVDSLENFIESKVNLDLINPKYVNYEM